MNPLLRIAHTGKVMGVSLTCLFALTACSAAETASPAAPAAEPPLSAQQAPSAPEAIALPLRAYRLSDAQIRSLAAAQDRLTNECLTKKGRKPSTSNDPGNIEDMIIARGLDGQQLHKTWGYFSPLSVSSGTGYVLQKSNVPPLADDVSGPADIIPVEIREECSAAARKAMPFGKDWGAMLNVDTLMGERSDAPDNDSRLVAINNSWSSCMKSQGFNAASPMASFLHWQRQRAGSRAPSPDEVAAAKADHECKTSTNYMATAVAVQSAYERVYIEKHRRQLDSVKGTVDDFLRTNA